MDDSYGTNAYGKDTYPSCYGTWDNPIRDSYPAYPNIEFGPYPPPKPQNSIQVWVPSFNKKTNYHLAGLVKCGLKLVMVPMLTDSDDDPHDPQYLWPSPDGYGAYFYISLYA